MPLALPSSRRVFECYASHGKAYGFASGPRVHPCRVRILAVNRDRETRWEDSVYENVHQWRCQALVDQGEWRRLGWVMPDGSLPFGDLEAVDPDMAQFDYLPGVNTPPYGTGYIRAQ